MIACIAYVTMMESVIRELDKVRSYPLLLCKLHFLTMASFYSLVTT